jgi:hypothetical protein
LHSRPHCESRDSLCVSQPDHYLFGVFPDATWRRLIDDPGLERVDVDDPMQTSTWCSLVRRSAGREIPAADEAG